MDLMTTDRDNVPAIVASANAFLLLNQATKARNQLKYVSGLCCL